eukprot:4260671-Pleurochrysis_carterae.AAC.1
MSSFPNLNEAAGSSQPSSSNPIPTVEEILSEKTGETSNSRILQAYYEETGKLMEIDEFLLRYPEMNELHDLNKQWKVAVYATQSGSVKRQKAQILDRMTEINSNNREQGYAYSEIATRMYNANSLRL